MSNKRALGILCLLLLSSCSSEEHADQANVKVKASNEANDSSANNSGVHSNASDADPDAVREAADHVFDLNEPVDQSIRYLEDKKSARDAYRAFRSITPTGVVWNRPTVVDVRVEGDNAIVNIDLVSDTPKEAVGDGFIVDEVAKNVRAIRFSDFAFVRSPDGWMLSSYSACQLADQLRIIITSGTCPSLGMPPPIFLGKETRSVELPHTPSVVRSTPAFVNKGEIWVVDDDDVQAPLNSKHKVIRMGKNGVESSFEVAGMIQFFRGVQGETGMIVATITDSGISKRELYQLDASPQKLPSPIALSTAGEIVAVDMKRKVSYHQEITAEPYGQRSIEGVPTRLVSRNFGDGSESAFWELGNDLGAGQRGGPRIRVIGVTDERALVMNATADGTRMQSISLDPAAQSEDRMLPSSSSFLGSCVTGDSIVNLTSSTDQSVYLLQQFDLSTLEVQREQQVDRADWIECGSETVWLRGIEQLSNDWLTTPTLLLGRGAYQTITGYSNNDLSVTNTYRTPYLSEDFPSLAVDGNLPWVIGNSRVLHFTQDEESASAQ